MRKSVFTTFTIVLLLFVSVSAFAQKASKNEQSVQKIMKALEAKDLATVTGFMTENTTLVHPITFSGATDNSEMRRFEGKAAVTGFVQSLFKDFKQIKFTDVSTYSANNGNTVFVEMKSEFVFAANDVSYKNVYVVKYDFENGKVVRIVEYYNPVPISELFKVKLGKQ